MVQTTLCTTQQVSCMGLKREDKDLRWLEAVTCRGDETGLHSRNKGSKILCRKKQKSRKARG